MNQTAETEAQHEKDTQGQDAKEKLLPQHRPYLWTSSLADHQDGELRFSGFEPCYVACIRDVEHQIKRKIQALDISSDSPGLAEEMAPLLVQYYQLIEALTKVESKDRVFEEDMLHANDQMTRYSGMRRRIRRAKDQDRVHDSLRQNFILVILGYVYNWDLADKLKRRFGNLTETLDRLLVGFAGGAALLVPMIMMTFLQTRTARLIIVSIATMLFAATMALTSASKDGVIGATAAYAAIMVVYIGSSEFQPDMPAA